MTRTALIIFILVTTGATLFPAMVLSADSGHTPAISPFILLETGIPWNTLSAEEQDILKKHRRNWTGYPSSEQNRLRDGARHYLKLSPNERDKVQRKQKQYREMTPAERKQLRDKYHKQKK